MLDQVEAADDAPPKDTLREPVVGPDAKEVNTAAEDGPASNSTVVSLQTESAIDRISEGRREQSDDNP